VRVEPGARAALAIRPWTGARFVPFLAASVEVVPSPYRLLVEPRGAQAALPSVWLLLSLGLSVRIR
jgi:hypothetical protein